MPSKKLSKWQTASEARRHLRIYLGLIDFLSAKRREESLLTPIDNKFEPEKRPFERAFLSTIESHKLFIELYKIRSSASFAKNIEEQIKEAIMKYYKVLDEEKANYYAKEISERFKTERNVESAKLIGVVITKHMDEIPSFWANLVKAARVVAGLNARKRAEIILGEPIKRQKKKKKKKKRRRRTMRW